MAGERGSSCFSILANLWQCLVLLLQVYTPVSLLTVILWAVLRPNELRPHIESAVLAELHYSTATATLRYDLWVDFSFRNSHERLSIHYDDIGATAYYAGARLGASNNELHTFYQQPKTTTLRRALFQGEVPVPAVANARVNETFARARVAGFVDVDVTVGVTATYEVVLDTEEYDYEYHCVLRFPVINGGLSSMMSISSCVVKG